MSYIHSAPKRNRDPDSWFNRVRARRAFRLAVPSGAVLDIGTAWGTIARHAARYPGVSAITGLDPDPDVADYWRDHHVPARLIVGTEIEGPFNTAYAIDVFEHMTDDEVRDVFRWLKARRLVVYCPNRTSIFERKKGHPSHVGMRTLSEFLALVPADWRIVTARHFGWRFFPWFNKRRWGVTLQHD